MAITQTLTTSFKVEILQGIHNFGPSSPDTFKIALYTSGASLDSDTSVYTPTGETSGIGYTTGGNVLTISVTPTFGGTTAYVSFDDTSWTTSTITAAGALIYNATKSNRAVAVLSFGGNKSSVGGIFTIQFPTATATSAIIRIA